MCTCVDSWPSEKLPIYCKKWPKIDIFSKHCQKFSFYFQKRKVFGNFFERKEIFWQFFWKKRIFLAIFLEKSQFFGNFLTVKWQFSGGSSWPCVMSVLSSTMMLHFLHEFPESLHFPVYLDPWCTISMHMYWLRLIYIHTWPLLQLCNNYTHLYIINKILFLKQLVHLAVFISLFVSNISVRCYM